MKTIAVIPARGGSKRIERKNIRSFCGKPIIAYSIEAAIDSAVFDEVIVSTDDLEIANVAKTLGASVPFTRPTSLSDDFVGVVPVVAHAIEAVGGANRACLIYATAPFISASDLKEAKRALGDNDFVLSIAAFEAPIFRALKTDESGRISSIWREYEQTRSQDLPQAFHDAAHFCFGRAEAFLEGRSIFNSRTIGYLIDKRRVQDIDDQSDWRRAEAMFRALACA
ncbi:MAG: pseudaminic acid cytidylyltransferase [Helicobacteraceae bacterium]|jgi:N-acylneuraminate cytidylyltransferase|nr:pseudaminic acid cytidylyltransferase [Helicobacteraceae bacterium]